MAVLWVLLAILGVVVAVVAALFVYGLVQGAHLDRDRQRVLAEQAQAEARIQLATSATLGRLFQAAREAQRQSFDQ